VAQLFTAILVSLKTRLDDLRTSLVQLPDFQLGRVWDSDRIRGVIASIPQASSFRRENEAEAT
jgi:hypothetical protein